MAMFMNYNLTLDGRTTKLEKKNGKELKRIEEVEKKDENKQEQINELKEKIAELERKTK